MEKFKIDKENKTIEIYENVTDTELAQFIKYNKLQEYWWKNGNAKDITLT